MARELIDQYTESDTTPVLRRELPASTGLTTLTGATVRLRIRRPDGIDLVKTITTADDPLQGHIDNPTATPPSFFFKFVASDLVEGKLQRAEIEYDDGAGGITTERGIFFDVAAELG